MLRAESFVALGTNNTVAVEDEASLPEAVEIVKASLAEIDRTCSRFRPDSELARVNRRAAKEASHISALLDEALSAAFKAAEMTGGLVDPTVGGQMEELGYTVTFRDMPSDGAPIELRVRKVAGWQSIDYDRGAHTIRLPEGVSIDLGASGKAWAADRCAAQVHAALKVAVLVDCGGDVAVVGRPAEGGWPVRVALDLDSADGQDIVLFDGGLATSGTTVRRWRRGGTELHHIIDPSTGLPAKTRWAMVTVAAATCLEANAAATAAVILDGDAPGWLEERRLPARLVERSGAVQRVGGWCA